MTSGRRNSVRPRVRWMKGIQDLLVAERGVEGKWVDRELW
jgi:hypothetical protein